MLWNSDQGRDRGRKVESYVWHVDYCVTALAAIEELDTASIASLLSLVPPVRFNLDLINVHESRPANSTTGRPASYI